MVSFSFLALIFGDCSCQGAFDCCLDIDSYGGILIFVLLMLYMFKALGIICDNYFVPSLDVIVVKLKLSPDVAGATFMAAGSSAPELFTSLVSTFLIINEGGIGAIIGSAIFNILVIVGATAIIACWDTELSINWYPLSRDTFFYVVAICELMAFLQDEKIELWESVLMVATYFLYILYMYFNSTIMAKFGIVIENKVEETKLEASDDSEGDEHKCAPEITISGPRAGSQGEPAPKAPTALPEVLGFQQEQPADAAAGVPLAAPRPSPKTSPRVPTPRTSNNSGNHLSTGSEGNNSGNPGERRVFMSESGRRKSLNAQPNPVDMEQLRRNSNGDGEGKAADSADNAQQGLMEEDEEPTTALGKICAALDRYDPIAIIWERLMPDAETHTWTLFSLSIFFIAACTYVMVDATNRMGCNLHIPPLVMGLIFLAAGTSIPDALGSIAVARQGEGDMAVCNALGSNVFDILLGLGVPWTIRNLMPAGDGPTPDNEVRFPGAKDDLVEYIIILGAIVFLFVGALILFRWKLNLRIGVLLVFLYIVYVCFTLLRVMLGDGENGIVYTCDAR